jgi:hypothetical protein
MPFSAASWMKTGTLLKVIWLSLVTLSMKGFVGDYVAYAPTCHGEGFAKAVREDVFAVCAVV